jgi:hypothetical protein
MGGKNRSNPRRSLGPCKKTYQEALSDINNNPLKIKKTTNKNDSADQTANQSHD